MSIDRTGLARLIPHAGNMCLLDEVVAYSPDHIHCISRSHRDPHHPLRREAGLSAIHLVEYGAQATAAHGALIGGGAAQPGMLAALREVSFHADWIDDSNDVLNITATRRLAQRDGSLYEFQVHAGERLLCAGRVAISFMPSADPPPA